ncbi:hypothetical protein BU25DRAFT_217438 [Macroventuria anomochaeta]|uniref:Uncharacterized protein n=1 Tax=Macroventuria anomochaeta TaxID=301207 RepID=A0ACB6RKD1_9PLEO|nr:uncharacterized protein BU25DRAFT_217438 [Macroventuria anomochaeta]KAF2622198.1 hypothetical protein BU25DRAFT_217438 [Macroventuria anomochaeta]
MEVKFCIAAQLGSTMFRPEEEPPGVYTAPSWSWAAVGTLAQFAYRFEMRKTGLPETMDLIEIIDASVIPKFDG